MPPTEAEAREDPAGLLLAETVDKVSAELGHGVHVVENQPTTLETERPVVEADEFFEPEILCFHDSSPFRSKSRSFQYEISASMHDSSRR